MCFYALVVDGSSYRYVLLHCHVYFGLAVGDLPVPLVTCPALNPTRHVLDLKIRVSTSAASRLTIPVKLQYLLYFKLLK